MLIDCKNTLYRVIIGYANRQGVNCTSAWFSSIFSMASIIRPDTINLYWDPKKNNIWRKHVYPEYKANRNNNAIMPNLNDLLRDHSLNIAKVAQAARFRQFMVSNQECDDLVYATCAENRHDQFVIISADSDLTQLYKFDNVKVFNPLKQAMVEKPDHDIAISKSLSGDNSDNIIGYDKIGKVTARKLALDESKRNEFLSKVDKTIFEKNMKLIDLSLNDSLGTNIEYINRVYSRPVKDFNMKEIRDMAFGLKINGLVKVIEDNQHQLMKLS